MATDLTVRLPDDLVQYVRDKVASGVFRNESEAVGYALAALRDWNRSGVWEPEDEAEFAKAMREGLKDEAEGRLVDGADALEAARARLRTD